MKVARIVAGATLAALMLAGCSSEIRGRDGSTQVTEPTLFEGNSTPDEVVEPDPISFAVGDCLDVDYEGVGVRFAAVVDCEGLHDAEVHTSLVVEEETLVQVNEWCMGELASRWDDPTRGRNYAVESPINYAYNQSVVARGDEVFCVYVHSEETDRML